MTALIPAIDSALLAFLWQGVVAALVLWLALSVLRRASPDARYLAGCIALGGLALAPFVTAWIAHHAPAAVEYSAPVVRLRSIPSLGEPRVEGLALARAWMLPAWACGVLLLSIRMLWGGARVARLKREGSAPDAALLTSVNRLAARVRVRRPVRVLVSSLADGPSVAGWLRPVLLLPAAAVLGLSPEQLEAVLAHELAHIRRYDYLVNLVQMSIETLFFYHPAVWWISRRIRMERELCCDDVAVRVSGDAVCYARALASLERMRVGTASLALGVKDGPLLYRIERLLGAAPRDRASSRLPGLIAVCLGLACFAPAVNPVKAQSPNVPAPLGPAPIPAASAPGAYGPLRGRAFNPAPAPLMQIAQTATAPVPLTDAGDVLVEIRIDPTGLVGDARVINGPMDGRREALITALNMRFLPQSESATRYVTVATTPAQSMWPDVVPVVGRAEAQQRVLKANAEIARLRSIQASASERGAAQLQEAIDRDLKAIADSESTAAGQDPLVGASLQVIRISGPAATARVRSELLSRLPIRIGDILSDASMQAAVTAVVGYYPRATALFGVVRDSGQGAFVVTLPYPLDGNVSLFYPSNVR